MKKILNNKILLSLLLIIICFSFIPNYVSATTINRTKKIWTGKSHLNYASVDYNTKGVSYKRHTSDLVIWKTSGGVNVFCVEPTVRFDKDSIGGYEEIDTDEDFKTLTTPSHKWDVYGDISNLKKVFSCWDDNDASLMATQAIVWELVTEERSSIDKSKILNDDYKPYESDGSFYGAGSNITSLYELISTRDKIYNAYKSVLRCAARFDETPSFSYTSASDAAKDSNKKKIDGTFTPATENTAATWSKTFNHSTSNKQGKDILKYYEVSSDSSDVKVKIINDGKSISVTTSKEILKEDAVKITLKYKYKDDGKTTLNTNKNSYFIKEDSANNTHPWYQTLGKGSTTKESYIYVYTGPKPTYQLRVKKIDKTTGKAMSGVQFDVYDKSGNKIGTTTKSGSDGYAYYKETGANAITKTSEYTIKEVGVVDGYLKNTQSVKINVSDSHRTGSNNYAESSTVFENTQNELVLTKQTIDENGKVITLSGDYCTISVCANEGGRENGPTFTMKKDGKYVCVTEASTGNYTYHSLSNNCPAGTTNKIRTCGGKFSVKKIPTGNYTVTETETACGYTLPSADNLSKVITVKSGVNPEPIQFINGVTGVIFRKISEDGYPLDGGTYALQRKVNGIYKDILLKKEAGVVYSYVEDLDIDTTGATYELETDNGILQVKYLPIGEYRFVEKQAPSGYDIIKDKDSKAIFTISDKGIFGADGKPRLDYYEVTLVNQKTKVEGSYDTAELIVTIITGRKVVNYVLLIGGLSVLLIAIILLRKKLKK